MRIVVAGSSGLLGTALCRSYVRDGHTVVRLVRRAPSGPGEVFWDRSGGPGPGPLEGSDVLVNLAGAGIGDQRWTRRYRALIRDSRVGTAGVLARLVTRAARPPATFLSASGIRYYGIDRGDEVLTEESSPDPTGLLPAVAAEWEAATEPAARAGTRVCHLRLGLVLSHEGGVLRPMLRQFRIGLGGPYGTGEEYWSYLTLTDAIRAVRFLAEHPGARGPYNVTGPVPVRNRELATALARMLRRPAVVRLPGWALRLALGGMADEVFGGLRVVPDRLTTAGFAFAHPDLSSALRAALPSPG